MSRANRVLGAVAAVVAAFTITVGRDAEALAADAPKLGLGVQGGIFNGNGSEPTTGLFGALLRFRLTPSIAVEASGAVTSRTTTAPVAGDVRIRTIPLFANLLVYLLPGPISPYISGGGGVVATRVDPDNGSSDTSYDVGGNVGAGVEFALGRSLTLGVDGRYLFLDRDSDLRTPGGGTRIDVSRRGYTLTGQLIFYF